MSTPPVDVKSIFEKALEITDPSARAAYLHAACGDNNALRAEIEGLLTALERAGDFMNRGPNPDASTGAFIPPEPPSPSIPTTGTTGTFDSAPVGPLETDSYVSPPRQQGPSYVSPPRQQGPSSGEGVSLGVVIAGKYKLIEEIGEGGMGNVFLAQQTKPVKRLVAVKVIKAGMDSKAVLARFEAERQALAMMDHPNIARVLDAGATEDGRPFFVMELVKGVPIIKFCDNRKLTPRQRLELFVPVCQAIQHAHQKGVIHRDIKPNNVLVAMYDDRPVPKVIDFGVAKATGPQLTEHTLVTGFGAIVGTPEYMSPEQASFNQVDVDTRSDVYALGVLLYELLTGSPPFSRKELEKVGLLEIFRVIREQEPTKPSNKLSTASGLPSLAANRGTEPRRLTAMVRGELDWIVMKALEKDRGRRYETANGFASDVQRYLAGEAVLAVPPSGWYRLKKMYRRNRGLVVAAGLVLFVLVSGIVGTTIGLFREEAARVQAQMERDEKEEARKESEELRKQADQQRKKAEYQAASIGIDLDMGDQPNRKVELLRLARRLLTIPEHAPELKDYVIRRMLVLGQEIRPFVKDMSDISPDGRLALCTTSWGNEIVLRETFNGRQVAIGRSQYHTNHPRFEAQGRVIYNNPHFLGEPVELWDTEGHIIMRAPPVSHLSVSSDGKRALIDLRTEIPGRQIREGSIIAIQLWDAQSGKIIAELKGHAGNVFQADFSSDSKLIVSADQNVVRVWSSEDGRFIRELGRFTGGVKDVSFSPDIQHVAVVEGTKLHHWRTKKWIEEEPPTSLPPLETNQEWTIRWYNDETLGVLSDAPSTFISGHGLVPGTISRIQGNLALRNDGAIFDLGTLRRVPISHDERFPQETARFAFRNRFLILHENVYHLKAGKFFWPVKDSPGPRTEFPLCCPNNCFLLFYDSSGSNPTLLPLDSLPFQESMIQWANVVARGELDQGGEYLPWDERKWELNRQALARTLSGISSDVWLSPVACDTLFWLREEIAASGNDFGTIPPKSLPLLDRLVASEPTWENYTTRANCRNSAGQYYLAIQDALEANRLAGVLIDPFSSQWNWYTGLQSGLNREHYELALRWEEAWRAAGNLNRRLEFPLVLYRLGRYAESLDVLREEEEKDFPVQIGRTLLTTTTAPLHRLVASAFPKNQAPTLRVNTFTALRAMCHDKLGQPDLALLFLGVANQQRREDEKRGEGQRIIPLYREAVELITGKMPSK